MRRESTDTPLSHRLLASFLWTFAGAMLLAYGMWVGSTTTRCAEESPSTDIGDAWIAMTVIAVWLIPFIVGSVRRRTPGWLAVGLIALTIAVAAAFLATTFIVDHPGELCW